MKAQHLRSISFDNKRRGVVALLSFVCLSLLVLTPGAAQLRDQRRVTAIQLGGAAEGSRVTVVSDSALSDYEAFRRGDRFYLKLPLADLASAAPHFRADGFEDVQVQKTGDGLIVSFKLQPGATARVDQHGNRLDVVFTAPNRSSSNNSTRSESGTQGSENSSRGRDVAGPTPADAASTSRQRFVSARPGAGSGSRWPRNSHSQTKPKTAVSKNPDTSANKNPDTSANKNSNPSANKNSSEPGNKQPTPIIAAAASPSPSWSPSAVASPGISTSYQPLTTTSPSAFASPQPVAGVTNRGGSRDWRSLQSAARQWISSNRLASLLGALILLSLIAYLVMAIRGRQQNGDKARLAKTPKVQPRYSGDELKELDGTARKPSSGESAPLSKTAVAGTTAEKDSRSLTTPAFVTPAGAHSEQREEDEDREVFEL